MAEKRKHRATQAEKALKDELDRQFKTVQPVARTKTTDTNEARDTTEANRIQFAEFSVWQSKERFLEAEGWTRYTKRNDSLDGQLWVIAGPGGRQLVLSTDAAFKETVKQKERFNWHEYRIWTPPKKTTFAW